jgi:CubicO group peptidase (beta-lactamase class C family)
MTRFLIANMNPNATTLSSSIKLAQTVQAEGSTHDSGVGLGWEISQPGSGSERIWKKGLTYSFSSYLSFQANGSIGFVLLTNGQSIDDFVNRLLNLLSKYGSQAE